MPDARGFMVAAYVLTILTLLVYAIRLAARARDTERRLAAAREEAASASADERAPRDGTEPRLESDALVGGHHVRA